MDRLFLVERSGKWKNRFLEVLGEVFIEAPRYGYRIQKPTFQRFAANSKKADIFTTDELDRIFQPKNFPSEQFYLFFLTCLSGGMRLGEVRGLRAKQLIFDRKILIIDGFCKKNGTRTNFNKKGTPDDPKFRLVYLPDLTLNKMETWIRQNAIQGDDFCFTINGRPIRQETAENAFYQTLQNTGIIPRLESAPKNKPGEGRKKQCREKLKPLDGRKLVPHSLRYTYVSRMRRELTAAELQPMTGHASVEMVDYYNRKVLDMALASLPPKGREAADTLFV
jgi:integrase